MNFEKLIAVFTKQELTREDTVDVAEKVNRVCKMIRF